MFLVNWKDTKMKIYFTAEEMHTPEYEEYVRWMSNVWRLNDERNQSTMITPFGIPYTEYCRQIRNMGRIPLSYESLFDADWGDEE
jgi:hypothetical protein